MPRKRSEERAKGGLVMRAFEMTTETDALIDRAVAFLSERDGRKCTKVRALAWLIREGAKKLPKAQRMAIPGCVMASGNLFTT